MSSSAVEKAAVLECLRRLSMTDVLVLDLEMMPQSHRLEFWSEFAGPIVDTSDLVASTVAYADFKKVMYECLQASLDVPIGGCKVIIRSSRTGKYADFITRFEKEFLNMIALDGMGGDGKRAVLHVENFFVLQSKFIGVRQSFARSVEVAESGGDSRRPAHRNGHLLGCCGIRRKYWLYPFHIKK